MNPPAANCPLDYRYRPVDFAVAPACETDTVYVVGGLYGNTPALHEILRMQQAEKRAGTRVELVFNGDHNWFDIDVASFREINQVALESVAIRGNVESELAQPSAFGCGCSYPDYVDADVVERSNQIMVLLQQAARDDAHLTRALGALPRFCVLSVGGERIGIVHGDAHSLSGWSFAAERLSSPGAGAATGLESIEAVFRGAGVRAFASSHTCLAHARDFDVDGSARLIINNGAAGMPNFAGSTFGVITRISVDPKRPQDSLYGIGLAGLRFDALPVRYDQSAWLRLFEANWSPQSPAYKSYFARINRGPDHRLRDAVSGRLARGS